MSMNPLQTLSAAALIGTDRRAPEWPALPGEVGALVQQVAADANADASNGPAFLRVAGVLGACHLAGMNPAASSREAPPVCPEETLKVLSDPPLLQALAGVLVEGPLRLQVEAFQLLAKHHYCLPHRLLPKALDAGRRSVALRESLLPVLGQRGAWLAAQHTDWAYAAGTGAGADLLAEESWEHGSLDQRKIYLRALRQVETARARSLVAGALATEGAKERAALLEELRPGLSLEDEDLIEPVFKDKSKEVREVASRLLGSLPQSRFMQRMAARLGDCIKMEKKFLRGEVVTLEPPATYHPEWKNDLLIEAAPQGAGMGQRAWWLMQITARTPLDWWVTRTGKKPAELLDWAQKTEWKQALIVGWAEAQSLQLSASWAAAFLDSGVLEKSGQNHAVLLQTLPVAERERHFLPILNSVKDKSAVWSGTLGWLLLTLPPGTGISSPDIARRLLRAVRDHIHSGAAQYDWQLRAPLVDLVCVLPPALLDEAVVGWDLQRPELQPFSEAVARLSVVADQRKLLHALRS